MKKLFMTLVTATAIILLITYPKAVIDSSVEALDTCINVLLPTLFPFFVLSKIFIGCGGAEILGAIFTPIMKPLFKISGHGATPFILGVTCGYPVGARTAIDMYNNSLINKKEAENLICFSNNSGPLFIIGAVGVGFMSSTKAGIFLYTVHILSAITIGVILKFSIPCTDNYHHEATHQTKKKNIFINAVEDSVSSILNVFAYVIFFAITMEVIAKTGILNTVASLLNQIGINKSISIPTLCSILEMTTGIKMLNANNLAFSTKLIMTSFMLGWSGLSIHFQTKGILGNTDLSFIRYVVIKFFHGLLSSVYAYIGMLFVKIEKSVFINYSYTFPYKFQIPDILTNFTVAICLLYFIKLVRSKNNIRYSKPRQTKAKGYMVP